MDDDRMNDRRPNRRTALGALGALGAAFAGLPLAAEAGPACVLSPELTAGPFFVDEHLDRSDVTGDTSLPSVRNAVPLRLALQVYALNAGRCAPLAGAHVDLWNADAVGTYSDVGSARGQRFLRGYQVTDRSGAVAFITVHPGWYATRTPHVHVLVRTYSQANDVTHSFATQLFFDDAINDAVLASSAYRPHGPRDTRNANDPFYSPKTLVALRRDGRGYAGTLALGVRFG
jgi:protocatechuate 3,4-dioxygenase beta subunit